MPDLSTHQSFTCVKALLIGDSGAGKTGALASLAKKFELFILDFDNGLDILTDPKILDPALRPRIHFHTLTDDIKTNSQGIAVPKGTPKAYLKSLDLLNDWKDGDKSYGPVTSWGPDRVLVLDSLTMQGNSCMRYVLHINGRDGERPTLPLWGDAIGRQESLLQILYSDSIKCHVLVIAHVTFIGDAENDEEVHGFPSALGSKLPPKVGRYFNTVMMAVNRGTGNTVARKIRTRSEGKTELKISAPSKVPMELPLDTGLLTVFEALTTKAS